MSEEKKSALVAYDARNQPSRAVESAVSWAALLGMPFVWFIFFIILMASMGIFVPVLGWLLSPMLSLLMIYLVQKAFVESRRRNGQMILGYLETAVRLNLPLTPFLIAAERSEKGRRRRQIVGMWRMLESGAPVASALESAPDMPREAVLRVAAMEPLGQLRLALSRTLEKDRRADADRFREWDHEFYKFYPLFLLYAIGMLVTGFMIFVVPKYREIFKDFKTALPQSTEILLAFADFVSTNWWLPLIAMLVFGMLLLFMVSIYLNRIFLPFLPMPRFDTAYEWVAWRLPLLRGLERDKAMAESCQLLADAIRAGVPLPLALERASILRINMDFRRRLVAFHDALLAGSSPADAATRAGLPGLLVGMLQPLSTIGLGESGADLFEFLARYYRQKFSRTLTVIRTASEPLFVLIFGAMVLFTVVALFSPLVKLIYSALPRELTGGVL